MSTKSDDPNLLTALLLLQMGLDGGNPEFGTLEDYAAAAHSFVHVHCTGNHSWDKAPAMLARIQTAAVVQAAARGPLA
jgi:hypothetical protein